MSLELDVEIVEEKHVSNPIAKDLLERFIKRLEATSGTTTMLIHRTMEYLNKFSKLDASDAKALDRELQAFSLKPETRVMIVNICPSTLDELRTLLVLEERTIDTEEAERILDIVNKYCIK